MERNKKRNNQPVMLNETPSTWSQEAKTIDSLDKGASLRRNKCVDLEVGEKKRKRG